MNTPAGIIFSSSGTKTSLSSKSREVVPRIPSGSQSPTMDMPGVSLWTEKIIVSSWRGSCPSKCSVQTMQ